MGSAEAIIKIREATAEDTQVILLLWRELMDYHAVKDPLFTRAARGDANFKKWLDHLRESDRGLVLVAEEDKTVIGYLLATETQKPPVFAETRMGVITDFLVSGTERRRGVGMNLVKTTVHWFREKGIERIECNVSMYNEVARKFWRRIGFDPYMEVLHLKG